MRRRSTSKASDSAVRDAVTSDSRRPSARSAGLTTARVISARAFAQPVTTYNASGVTITLKPMETTNQYHSE